MMMMMRHNMIKLWSFHLAMRAWAASTIPLVLWGAGMPFQRRFWRLTSSFR